MEQPTTDSRRQNRKITIFCSILAGFFFAGALFIFNNLSNGGDNWTWVGGGCWLIDGCMLVWAFR
ncbi:MAG TPA: hypothetical protein VMS08_00245, partial [Candidatus Saccharimonadia bacterium]|nr:hypothetical protein [Candidatus Saccharimonadia bacterium]